MFAPLAKLKLARAFLGFMKEPERTEEVFNMAEAVMEIAKSQPGGLENISQFSQKLMALPEVAQLYQERYLPRLGDLDTLSKLPPGTLGREFADHMIRNHLSVDFFPDMETQDLSGYAVQRTRQTHDILHVVLDYDTSRGCEVAVQGFYLAQVSSPVNGLIIAAGLLNTLRDNPRNLHGFFALVTEGFQRGQAARHFLGVRWEDQWDRPLHEVRELARVPARPPGAYGPVVPSPAA